MLEKGRNVERSNLRAALKGLLANASRAWIRPSAFFFRLPHYLQWSAHVISAVLIFSSFSILQAYVSIQENVINNFALVPFILGIFVGGRLISRASCYFSAAGGWQHILLGMLLIPLWAYVSILSNFMLIGLFEILTPSEIYTQLEQVSTRGEIKAVIAAFSIHAAIQFVFFPWILWIYGLSKSEQQRSRVHSEVA